MHKKMPMIFDTCSVFEFVHKIISTEIKKKKYIKKCTHPKKIFPPSRALGFSFPAAGVKKSFRFFMQIADRHDII